MNIGIVLGQTFVGGMERQVGHLSKGFLNRGVNVYVYTVSPNISFEGKAKVEIPSKIVYPLWGTKYTLRFSEWLLTQYCKKHKIDVLIAFQIGSIELCNSVKSQLGFPYIIGNIRGIKYAFYDELRERYRLGCNKTDAIVCNSKAGKRLLNKNIVESEKIAVTMIPNIVSVPNINLIINKDQFIVLFAGSLKQVKDPFTFLNGVELALKENPMIKVIIAGDGHMREVLEAFVFEKGLQENIQFLGSVKPEAVPYDIANLVVSTSIREASSNTILEALANGACVIGTDVGGTTELLKDKTFGRLIQIGDVVGLGKSILYYSRLKTDELEKKGKDAIDFVKLNFEKEKIYDAYLDLCEKLKNG